MLNKSVRQSVCSSLYVPNTQFLNKLCLCWSRTLSCAGLGLLWALRGVRSISRGCGRGEFTVEGRDVHQGWVGARSCQCVTGTTIPQCPGPSPGSRDGAAREGSAAPAPSNPIHGTISGTPASLQQPRHRSKASQGFVITPHG